MSNKYKSDNTNVFQTVESEAQDGVNFSPAIKEPVTKVSDAFTLGFTTMDDNEVVPSVQLHNIFRDSFSVHLDGCGTRHSHEEYIRSHSTSPQASVDEHSLHINYIKHIPRASRTTQPTASQDIPLAILERMAYDTAVSKLNLRVVSSVTSLSLALNSDRCMLGRSARENQVQKPFSQELSNRMAVPSLAAQSGEEVPLTFASLASSNNPYSEVNTSQQSDTLFKNRSKTCHEHVVSESCSDEINSRFLTRRDRDASGKRLESHFTETNFDQKPLPESRSDGLNVVSSKGALIGSDKPNEHQRSLDAHSVRPLVPELLVAIKQQEPQRRVLSLERTTSGNGLNDEGGDSHDPHEVLLGKPAGALPSSFPKAKEASNYDRLVLSAPRFFCPLFHSKTPTQCRGRCSSHLCICSGRNTPLTVGVFPSPKQRGGRGAAVTWATPDLAPPGAMGSSHASPPKAGAVVAAEPFRTWTFPALSRSLSSPFQSPFEEALFGRRGGDPLEGPPADVGGALGEAGPKRWGRGPHFASPRVRPPPEQTGGEALWSARSWRSRVATDPAATGRRAEEVGQDAQLPPSSTKDNVELLRTRGAIHSAYMQNCSTRLGSARAVNNYEDNNSSVSNGAWQQPSSVANNFQQKSFQAANSLDSRKYAHSYSIHTPSTSVSGALSRSSGYYSFGNRLSLHHPNYQKIAFIPQHLGSVSHTRTPSYSPNEHAIGERLYSDVRLLKQEKCCMNVDPTVATSIRRRPLLLSTVFLRNTWAILDESKRGGGGTEDQKEGGTEYPPSNASVNDGLSYIPQDHAQTNELPNAFPNTYSADLTLRGSSSSDVTSSLTARNKSMERTIMTSDATLNTLSPDYSPLGHTYNDASERSAILVDKSTEFEPLNQKARHSPRDPSYKARSPSQHSSRYNAQDPFTATNPPLQEQPRPSLTQFNRIVRHRHHIDNLDREVDNESNDLVVYVGTRLMGWLEVVALLGSGSFGQVFLCMDLRISNGYFVHPSEIGGEDFAYWSCSHEYLPLGDCDIPPVHSPFVAVKVVKSIPLFEQQSVLEAEMLVLIGVQTAVADSLEAASPMSRTQNSVLLPPPPDPRCAFTGKILAHGICYGHHCIVMERYGANLYEYIQSRQHNGLPMYQIRAIAKQLLSALTLLHENCHIIHADIKPENLLLTLNSCHGMHSSNHMQHNSATIKRSVSSAAARPPNSGQAVADSAVKKKDGETHHPYQKLVTPTAGNPFTSINAVSPRARSDSNTLSSSHCFVGNQVNSGTWSEPYTKRGSLKQRSRTQSVERSHIVVAKPQRFQDPNHTPSQQQLIYQGTTSPVASLVCPNSSKSFMCDSTSLAIPRLHIKLIDFSSSCYDAGPFYTYIQSRYYRAPEVIVRAGYGPPIDLWSTGCVLVELLLGMPLLPGCNDHHQLTLIEEMVGPLPVSLLECGDNTHLYYEKQCVGGMNSQEALSESEPINNESTTTATSQTWRKVKTGEHVDSTACGTAYSYKLIDRDNFLKKSDLSIVEYKRYFTCKTLQELVRQCPFPLEEKRVGRGLQPYASPSESDDIPPDAKLSETMCNELMRQRFLFYDLLRQLLNPDPLLRPTASQALSHPFLSDTFTYMQQFDLE